MTFYNKLKPFPQEKYSWQGDKQKGLDWWEAHGILKLFNPGLKLFPVTIVDIHRSEWLASKILMTCICKLLIKYDTSGGDKLNNDPTKAFKSTALQISRLQKRINKKLWSACMHSPCLASPFCLLFLKTTSYNSMNKLSL